MNRLLLSAAMLTSSIALADPLPPQLAAQYKPLQISESSLEKSVVRVKFKRPVVSQEIFRNFVYASCTPLMLDPKNGWGKAQIDRIEAVNDAGAQGFAFVGGRKACSDLGVMVKGDQKESHYFAAQTWVCVAGNPCRPRQPGEKVAGD